MPSKLPHSHPVSRHLGRFGNFLHTLLRPILLEDIFFLWKRRPRSVATNWSNPASPADYHAFVTANGFIATDQRERLKFSPSTMERLYDLEQQLLPSFFEANQKAAVYQNMYLQAQWFVVFAGAIAGLFGAFSLLSGYQHIPTLIRQVLDFFIIVLGMTTLSVTVFDQQRQPKDNWLHHRKLAEELRRIYYLYLADALPNHLASHDLGELIDRLTKQPDSLLPEAFLLPRQPPTSPFTAADAQLLTTFYMEQRVHQNLARLEARIRENKYNSQTTLRISLLFSMGAIYAATINVSLGSHDWLAFLAAAFSLLGGLMASFEHVYEWESETRIFLNTLNELEIIKYRLPIDTDNPPIESTILFAELVASTERVLAIETALWGGVPQILPALPLSELYLHLQDRVEAGKLSPRAFRQIIEQLENGD